MLAGLGGGKLFFMVVPRFLDVDTDLCWLLVLLDAGGIVGLETALLELQLAEFERPLILAIVVW